MGGSVRVAEMKSGGDLPFLSQPEEVSLFVEVHMRGIGVFAGGRAPALAGGEGAVLDSWVAARQGSGLSVPSHGAAASAAEEPAPPPARRPKWINPFEDPPQRPRWINPFEERIEDDPLL